MTIYCKLCSVLGEREGWEGKGWDGMGGGRDGMGWDGMGGGGGGRRANRREGKVMKREEGGRQESDTCRKEKELRVREARYNQGRMREGIINYYYYST